MLAAVACSTAAVLLLATVRNAGTPEGSIDGSAHGTDQTLWGVLLLLAAVFCEASYVVIGKRLSARVSPRRVTALINLWGLALSTPLAIPVLMQFDLGSVTATTWALFLFYALSASVLTVWLWMRGLQQVMAQQAGIFTVMLPLTAAGIGVLVLGEPVTAWHGAALVLAVTAVWLATRPSPQDPHHRSLQRPSV